MPQVGNKKYPYTKEGMKQAEEAQAKQEDFNWDEIKKSMGEGEIKLMEKPLYDGTPPQVDKIGTAPPSTGKPTIATPMIATPMTPDETSFYQERLNDLGFELEVDGVYGTKTAEADSLYNAYSLKNFDDNYIQQINYAKKMGFPAHLLEDGNEALYNKWEKGTWGLSDEEYKTVYPDAKSNAEILSEVQNRLFNAIKKVK